MSIYKKVILIAGAILSIAIGINTIISTSFFNREYSKVMENRAIVISQSLKSQLDRLFSLGIPLNELVGFEEQCKEVVNEYKDVKSAMVVDSKGKILFHNDPAKQNKTMSDRSALDYIRGSKNKPVVIRDYQEKDYNVAIPVYDRNDQRVGVIMIEFSLEPIIQKTRALVGYLFFVTFISLIIAISLLFWCINIWINRPLTKLLLAIQEIGKKGANFKGQVEIYSQDELGRLAASFNQMIENLKKITVSRDELFDEIRVRKQAEEELEETYNKLKSAQFQLVQSAKMASVGTLAGGVAHEINNPLTGVLNNVQLIKIVAAQKQDFKMADFLELLNVIEESAQRCTKITRSLLSFSRAPKGFLKGISINEIAEKVLDLIEHELGLQNIVIQRQLQPDLPFIHGEPQLIQQVVFDIIINAKWAIQKRSVQVDGIIAIKTEYHPGENKVCLFISDNGIGIPKDNLEKIFEPFFTTKEIGEGTGLGLSMVYNIIKEHQGYIKVESELGVGTEFKIYLPVTMPGSI